MGPSSKLTVLYLDNNVWDLFYECQIDPDKDLPSDEFTLRIIRETWFEISPIRDSAKKAYIERFLASGRVRTDSYFGFYDEALGPHEQRVSGFGDVHNPDAGGRFIEESEAQLFERERHLIRPPKSQKTGLLKHEADVSLAARSVHSVVLTRDARRALKRARLDDRCLVIDLNEYVRGTSLAEFIRRELRSMRRQESQ